MRITKYMTGPIQANTYLVYDEETKKGFMVDPGGYEPRLTAQIKDEKVDLEYFILTHGHGDHIGGVDAFKKDFPQVKVVACKAEDKMLHDPGDNCSIEMFRKAITIDADILVDDRETLKVGNMELTFIHTPGHTEGGMCIYVDGHLFSGDTLFCRSIGRTDFPGGNFNDIIKSIKEKLFAFPDDTVVLPGHMGQTTIGDEKKGNPFVRN